MHWTRCISRIPSHTLIQLQLFHITKYWSCDTFRILTALDNDRFAAANLSWFACKIGCSAFNFYPIAIRFSLNTSLQQLCSCCNYITIIYLFFWSLFMCLLFLFLSIYLFVYTYILVCHLMEKRSATTN